MMDSGSDKSNPRPDKNDVPLGREVLRRRSDFLYVQRSGIRQVMPHFILQAAMARPSLRQLECQVVSSKPTIGFRTGVTASKKVGNAVARNRAKRRMRALFHQLQAFNIPTRTDFVLVARQSLLHAGWTELSEDFSKATKRIQKKLIENGIER